MADLAQVAIAPAVERAIHDGAHVRTPQEVRSHGGALHPSARPGSQRPRETLDQKALKDRHGASGSAVIRGTGTTPWPDAPMNAA